MTSQDPYVLTPMDLLAAEARLFQADVDLLLRARGATMSALGWPDSPTVPAADVTPKGVTDEDLGDPAHFRP